MRLDRARIGDVWREDGVYVFQNLSKDCEGTAYYNIYTQQYVIDPCNYTYSPLTGRKGSPAHTFYAKLRDLYRWQKRRADLL